MSLDILPEIRQHIGHSSVSAKRKRDVDENEEVSKWRPYWQRGQTTLDEMNEHLRKQNKSGPKRLLKTANSPRKTKLYHSNIDLRTTGKVKKKVKISKYASTQGLNRMPPIVSSRKLGSTFGNTRLSRGNSSLNLPNIDPEQELTGDPGSRDNSAATSCRMSTRQGQGYGLFDSESESESEVDIYPSDEDPDVSRQNLDKAGEYIVEHDWILKESLAKEARKVTSLHNKVSIVLPDEDPLESIKSRLDEIQLMVKPKAELGNFLDTIDPEQKDKIVRYKYIDHRDIRKKRRKNWTVNDRFRDAVRQVILMFKACRPRRRYLHEDKPDTNPDGVKRIKHQYQGTKVTQENNPKSSLGYGMQLALVTQEYYRTEDDIKTATQILRATKAFKHLFPAQLEKQLARVVYYERYDGHRVVAQQGREPERFYFILTGKFIKVREYRLLSGIVTREEGYIEKGNSTDPQEMSQNWLRENHLVTKGNVEVLILDRQDFLDMLHTCKGPPIDFLQGLDLFKEFPCQEFLGSPDAIDFRYYGQENLIVKDSNRTPWLHVVKTGRVKVVRNQAIIDVQNEDKFAGQTREDLGCVRPFSHAGAMLGILAKQRKMKTLVGTLSLPELNRLYHRPSLVSNQLTSNVSSVENSPRIPISNKKISTPNSPNEDGENSGESTARDLGSNISTSNRLDKIQEDNESNESANEKKREPPNLVITSPRLKPTSPTTGRNNSHKSVTLPPIQISKPDEFEPHGTYLTREKTEMDPIYKKKNKKENIQRETHLQLDVLKPGDIFGLEHMEPQALASEAPGVSLVSDGAEIIRISKRFFLQHAKNNTMLKVETMQREYMSPDEAKTVMYDKETWRQYKSTLLQRTVENLHRKLPEKVP